LLQPAIFSRLFFEPIDQRTQPLIPNRLHLASMTVSASWCSVMAVMAVDSLRQGRGAQGAAARDDRCDDVPSRRPCGNRKDSREGHHAPVCRRSVGGCRGAARDHRAARNRPPWLRGSHRQARRWKV
jgi:hypothetical protein